MKAYTWRAAIVNSDLAPTTRHVLLTLSLYINEMGQSAYPSIERLAKETGLSERAVGTHLRGARDTGWLKVGKFGFGDQRWATNCYFPQLPGNFEYEEREIELPKGQERASFNEKKGQERRSKGQERASSKVRNDVPTNNSVELSNELSSVSKRAKKPQKLPIPDDFSISPAVEAWAMENGHTDLKAHFESFVGKAKAKGYVYVNWDQAFQNAIREDWAKVNERKAAAQRPATAYQQKHNQQQALINRISGGSNATRTLKDIN